jgi:hypothetical protein
LLAATATLQRTRLAQDVQALRQSCQPMHWLPSPAWALPLSAWALRGLRLWRAARALQRLAK